MRKIAAAAGMACLMAAAFPYCALGAQTGEQTKQQENSEYSIPGTWTGDSMDSRYLLEDGTFLEKSWLFQNGRWYYLDENGYPAAGWNKIKGKWYYFSEDTGRMAVGWAYNHEEDEWYYLNEDGTRKTGWLQSGGIWYWLNSDGVLYDDGWRMVDGHKYYFHSNGQLAAGQYIGTAYYGADSLRNPAFDMNIQGKRKPSDEEKEAITRALENIPRQWMDRFLADGWEFMYYTDRKYMEAPMTDRGVYYVHHKTDQKYKKIKFTEPESLTRAFGEYVAAALEADPEQKKKAEELYFISEELSSGYKKIKFTEPESLTRAFGEYVAAALEADPEQKKKAEELYFISEELSSGSGLPDLYADDYEVWFGVLFENYCDSDIRSEMQMLVPELCSVLNEMLGADFEGLRPSAWEMTADGEIDAGKAFGPALDPELNPPVRGTVQGAVSS